MGSLGAACAGEKSLPQLLIKSRLLQVLNRSVGKAVQMSTLILSRQEKKNNKKSAGVAGTSNSNSLSQPGWEELGVGAHSPGPAAGQGGWHENSTGFSLSWHTKCVPNCLCTYIKILAATKVQNQSLHDLKYFFLLSMDFWISFSEFFSFFCNFCIAPDSEDMAQGSGNRTFRSSTSAHDYLCDPSKTEWSPWNIIINLQTNSQVTLQGTKPVWHFHSLDESLLCSRVPWHQAGIPPVDAGSGHGKRCLRPKVISEHTHCR